MVSDSPERPQSGGSADFGFFTSCVGPRKLAFDECLRGFTSLAAPHRYSVREGPDNNLCLSPARVCVILRWCKFA